MAAGGPPRRAHRCETGESPSARVRAAASRARAARGRRREGGRHPRL